MKKILIIGGTSAIAVEIARIYANRGDGIFLLARDKEKVEQVAQDLKTRGASIIGYAVADLADTDKHQQLLREARQTLGEIDIAVIAHGSLSDQAVCNNSYAETEKELRVNLLSPISFMTNLAADFENRRSGHLVVLSSVAGERGRKSNYIYGTAKGALSIFAAGLRNRLFESGVKVTTVKPGFVDTPMTDKLKKGFLFAKADIVAEAIVRAVDQGKENIYVPWFWRLIMRIIREIPEPIFKRLSI